MRGHRRRIALLTLAAATTLGACRQVAPDVTGVRIIVSTSKAFDQIDFGIDDSNGNPLFAPRRRPADGGTTLAGSQDFVIYLDDDRAEMKVACTATAFFKGSMVATGKSIVFPLIRRKIVQCMVKLDAAGGNDDGGAETSAPDAGAMNTADAGPPDAPDAATADKPEAGADAAADQQMGKDSLIDLPILNDLGLPI